MTFREKLADWLTGGKYSKALESKRFYDTRTSVVKERAYYYQKALNAANDKLREISSIPVTPSSNGQTRKAVRIAKEALK